MSYFVYRSLTPHKRRIRLIHLLPERYHASKERSSIEIRGDPDSLRSSVPISCTISHVTLDDAPAYTALSYHWGDQSRTCAIRLNGAKITVTENLGMALYHLRQQEEPLTLWVDALCIDQSDEVEKSEQVQQMRTIYSKAYLVITWLGPAADNSDLAMQWIQQYGQRAFCLGIGSKPELYLGYLLEVYESREKVLITEDLKAFVETLKAQLLLASPEQTAVIIALSRLLNRAYWSRIWVVQELANASTTQFVCGKASMTEDALHHALRLLRNFRLQQLRSNQDTPSILAEENSILSIETRDPINLLKIRRAPGPSPLIYLVRSLHHFQATDPRDKVFALLGIASDAEALGLRPDYRKSCQEVYVDLARTLVQNGYIDLLSLCEFPKQVACLPSWVPDWSQKRSRSPLQQRALDRSARPLTTILQPKFSASASGSTTNPRIWTKIGRTMPLLLLSAIFLGEVQRLGAAWEHEGVGRWLNDLYELSHTTSNSPALSEGQTQAVWRTAVADMEIRQGAKKPRLSEETTGRVHKALEKADLSVTDPQTLIKAGLGDYCNQLQEIAQGRRPLLASGCYLGIGPRETELGDLVFILDGADVPFILRRHHDDDETLRLVGEAYVHGIMDGEVMEGSPLVKTISLS